MFFFGGGFLSEGGFGRRRGFRWRGVLAGGGVLLEFFFLAGGGVLSGVGFCPVPIDNNGGYTK